MRWLDAGPPGVGAQLVRVEACRGRLCEGEGEASQLMQGVCPGGSRIRTPIQEFSCSIHVKCVRRRNQSGLEPLGSAPEDLQSGAPGLILMLVY